jgi:hypothetical protein
LDFIPFIPASNLVLTALSLEVTTLVAASTMKVGIYTSNSNGTPNALVSNSNSGDLLGSALGVVTFTFSGPITLVAGSLYYLAVHWSSTTALRAIPVAALLPLSNNASGTTVNTVARATVTYTSGLPAIAPSITATSSIAPWVRMTLGTQ